MRQKIAAGNWKMNGTSAALDELTALSKAPPMAECTIVICPPAPLLYRAVEQSSGTAIKIGAQDCHTATSGAHTGDVSAPMVADTGASYVIVGHSERREAYEEQNSDVLSKAEAARDAGLIAILFLGETLEDREANNTLDIIGGQLTGSVPDGANSTNLVVAYEPIWAIGTGLTATPEQAQETHAAIRKYLGEVAGADVAENTRILYGGSASGKVRRD